MGFRRPLRGALGQGLLAMLLLALALWLAWHHPIAPIAATLMALGAAAACLRWPGAWLLLLPAALPWLNFAPWTGWLMVDEFDVCVLALLAGAYARRARTSGAVVVPPPDLAATCLVALCGLSGLVSLIGGLADAGALPGGWFDGYVDPTNSLRVAKSLLYAVLWWPLLRHEVAHDADRATRRLFAGMLVGLTVVVVASIWERLAYVRLLDFDRVYRVTALFWEMHVGGGAIDVYLALAMPFCIVALHRARGLWWRMAALLLVLGVLYACAATISRGVYGAVLVCGLVLALAWRRQRRVIASRRVAAELQARVPSAAGWYAALLVVIVLLVDLALGPRSFMALRWAQTAEVLDGRWAHWREGIGTLGTPAQWMLGRGLGRIPSLLQDDGAGASVSGGASWHAAAAGQGAYVALRGPVSDPDLRGLFALTQRVALLPGRRYVLELELRAPRPTALAAEVCQRHLLYDRRCQQRWMTVPATGAGWVRLRMPLIGAPSVPPMWALPSLGMLALSVPDVGGQVEIRAVALRAGEHAGLLANGGFEKDLAHWFPAAQLHFLPWHLDSLYFETLVERGVLGLVLLLAMLALAARRLWHAAHVPMAPCLAASLACVAAVGAVSSVMDVPRVASLFWLLLLFTLCLTRHGSAQRRGGPVAGVPSQSPHLARPRCAPVAFFGPTAAPRPPRAGRAEKAV